MSISTSAATPRRSPGVLASALSGAVGRVAFAPYLWNLAAERSGATECVAALTAARQLVEGDAVHVPVERAATQAFEALERLAAMARDYDLVAVIPGPVALGALNGTDDADAMRDDFEDLARAVLEARCDVLAVREPDPDPGMADSFGAMAKLAGFYGVRTLVLGPANAEFVVAAGFDALDAGKEGPVAVGIPVVPASPDGVPPTCSVVTSSWSAPAKAADVEWLRRVGRLIRDKE